MKSPALCFHGGGSGVLAPPRACSRRHAFIPVTVEAALLLALALPAVAQVDATPVGSPSAPPPAGPVNTHPYAVHVAEASRRFGIPEAWIWSVMRVESAGNPAATSHAGAMGLMQVMPDTYAELRSRHGLGSDPYDRRDNILAGAAYLREMHDRYGATGMLAAYNAGPGRWEDYISRGRPLPAETVAYMARLGSAIDGSAAPLPTVLAQVDRFAWRRASLFVALDESVRESRFTATARHSEGDRNATVQTPITSAADDPSAPPITAGNALFAIRRPE